MKSDIDNMGDAKTAAQKEYNKAVTRDFKHNVKIFVAFDAVWGLGIPFALYATVVPAYMVELNASKTLIGFISSLVITACPLQLLVSHHFRNRPRKLWLTGSYIACILPWLVYNILSLIFPESLSNAVRLVLFCVCMVIFMGSVVGNASMNFSLAADCIPLKKRGSIFGYRLAAFAIAVLLMSPAAIWVMKYWNEPQNFIVAFIVANIFYISASLILLAVCEHRDPSVRNVASHHTKVNRFLAGTRLAIRKTLREPNYRLFLFFIALFFLAMMMGSFFIIFAKETLSLKGEGILTFTVMQITSAALFALVLGKLADRIGYKTIGIIQGLMLTVGFVIACFVCLQSTPSPLGIYLAFVFYASTTSVAYMVMVNMSIELLPRMNRATILALGNTLMMPAILIAVPLSGLIIDITQSYLIVFALGAAFAAVSTLGFALLVREPRKRKMYVIKYIKRP